MPCNQHGENCDGMCIDPNVDNGMMTKVWGPAGWLFLHCITFGYPYSINQNNEEHNSKKHDYYNFFYYLGKILPCRYCRESYDEYFKQLDLYNSLNTRKDITKWLFDIHNKINHKLGVPNCNITSFEEVINKYEDYRAKCKKTSVEERSLNQNKGCLAPANGTPQRCVVKVVPYDKGDVTRRVNTTIGSISGTSDDYLVVKKSDLLFYSLLTITILSILIVLFKFYPF